MSPSTNKQERISNAIIGLVLIIIGIIITYLLFNSTPRGTGGSIWEWFIFIGPLLFLMGIVMLIRGLIWGQPAFSGRTVLYTGLLMLLIGAFPWIYTGSGEGGGMLGTLIFILVGIPGLILTIIGFFIRDW